MRSRKYGLSGLIVLAILLGGWLAWRYHKTPAGASIPHIPLEGVEPAAAEAILSAEKGVKERPNSGDSWGKLGMVLQANGFVEYVEPCYREASRLVPDNRFWPYLLGLRLLEVNPAEALPLLEKSLALSRVPDEQAAIHFRLFLALIEFGRIDAAAEHLNALRVLKPQDARVQFGSGMLALTRGDRSTARGAFAGLASDPFARKRATTLLAGLVEPGESGLLRDRVAQMPPDQNWPDPIEERMNDYKVDRTLRFQPVWEMQAQGRADEAIDYLRRLVAESPDRESCFLLGSELAKRGELEEAEAVLLSALRFEPENIKTHVLLASCRLRRGEMLLRKPAGKEEAMQLFRKSLEASDTALAMNKDLAAALLLRAAASKHLGRKDEAIRALRRAVLINPDSSEAHLALGELLGETGEMKEAIDHLRIAVEFASPGDKKPLQTLELWRKKATPTGGRP